MQPQQCPCRPPLAPRALVKTPSHLPNLPGEPGASQLLPEVEAGCRSPKSCYTTPAWCFALWHRDAQGGVPVAAPLQQSCPGTVSLCVAVGSGHKRWQQHMQGPRCSSAPMHAARSCSERSWQPCKIGGGGSPAGHPHHPKKPSQNPTGTEPSGEGQFRATGSRDGDKDSARFPPGSGYFAAALRFHLFSQPSHVAVAQDPSPEPGTSPYLLLAWSALEERR